MCSGALTSSLHRFEWQSTCESEQNDSSDDDTLPPSPPSSTSSVCPALPEQHSRPLQFPRSLELDYYERDEETLEKKWKHMDVIDSTYDSREDRILSTVLAREDTVLELNPFPYVTPPGVSHHTLWCIEDMSTKQIEDFVCSWMAVNTPQAIEWNFDENLARSIDLFHVHVYIRVPVVDRQNLAANKRERSEVTQSCETGNDRFIKRSRVDSDVSAEDTCQEGKMTDLRSRPIRFL